MSERYLLRIEKPAVEVLDTLPHEIFKQIILKLFALQSNPKPEDCKQSKGHLNGYRVNQGEYRILYTFEEREVRVFRVIKCSNDEVYHNL